MNDTIDRIMGEMYIEKGSGRFGVEYIVMAELVNIVALMNAETNEVFWVTKNVMQTRFELKSAQSTPTKNIQGRR